MKSLYANGLTKNFFEYPYEHRGTTLPLAPDVYLPAQVPRRSRDSPCVRLYVALLQNAIDNLRGSGVIFGLKAKGHLPARRRFAANEAVAWILSNDREWPASFLNVCGVLGLNVTATRKALLGQYLAEGKK